MPFPGSTPSIDTLTADTGVEQNKRDIALNKQEAIGSKAI